MSVESKPVARTEKPSYAEAIDAVALPDPVLDMVEEYEAVGGERDRFVWKWIYSLFPEFTLSSVPERHMETARTNKTLFTIFITLLDDIAERDGDARTFDRIRRVVRQPDVEAHASEENETDTEVVRFATRLWTTIEERLAAAPRYGEFRDVFRYDLRQALNAMEYSRVLNDHLSMANLSGTTHYDSHNMVMFPYADIDVMYSPAFAADDLGVVRELIWDLQQMARIGNWLTTWEREVDEGDYTAGIVVYALQSGIVTREELEAAGTDGETTAIDQIKACKVEDVFLAEWHTLRQKVADRGLEAESVDLDAFVEGMETVMDHHLASEGYK